MNTINFYLTDQPYGCFSNFSRHSIALDGKIWPTSEHYFQAMKFVGTEHEEQILHAETPAIAAKMGRERNRPLRSDWEQVKDDVMRKVVLEKVLQNADVLETLVDTGDAILVEHTENDSYWGDGGDGLGKNMLGKILMEIRDNFVKLPLSSSFVDGKIVFQFKYFNANDVIRIHKAIDCNTFGPLRIFILNDSSEVKIPLDALLNYSLVNRDEFHIMQDRANLKMNHLLDDTTLKILNWK